MKTPLSLVLVFSATCLAQTSIPAGTILPVQLNSSLRSNKAHPGQIITARIMQDVPLAAQTKIPAGSKAIGHVVSVQPANTSQNAEITVRFDTVATSGKRIPVTTNLRALASMMEVNAAQVPESGPDRGTPANWWTTEQIGGQVNYRNGAITEQGTIVGHSTAQGVLARVSGAPGTGCHGELEGNDLLQALWVFSSNACGLYGYDDLVLKHAGRSEPLGQITLQSAKGDVNVRAGSGMLLRVIRPER